MDYGCEFAKILIMEKQLWYIAQTYRTTFRICVHNGEWIPTDFDGITLIKRPIGKANRKENKPE